MSKRKGPNKQNLEETRRIFLDVAKEEFVENGYNNASTSRIVEKSGMARGSLYYHFGDKYGLFQAVYTEMMENALKLVSKTMDDQNTAWESFIKGCMAFLDICMNKDYRTIALIESQSALSFDERMEIMQRTLLGKLVEIINELMNAGCFKGHTPKTATIFILGILTEIGRSFNYSQDIKQDRKDHGQAFIETMNRLRDKDLCCAA